jgi:predicted lipoprotein with Yx(FWY)xxD motif
MKIRSRVVAVGVASAVLAGSGWGASQAFGAVHQPAAHQGTVVFETRHIAGVAGRVLVEGPGLVVYTFTGDKPGKPGTCTGGCAAIWPPLHGIPVVVRGFGITGKFRRLDGQITYNGWPLYLFAGEKPGQNDANSSFKVVSISASPAKQDKPAPGASPLPPAASPTPTATSGW